MPGKYFDDLKIGMTFQHSLGRTITEADNTFFNAITMNTQPLHLNEDFSSKTQFGKKDCERHPYVRSCYWTDSQ